MDSTLAPPPVDLPHELRAAPPPLHGGPLTLLRFMRRNRMLNRRYALLLLRLAWLKLRFRGRLQTDGIAFVCPGVQLEIGRDARVVLGRWSWLGHGTKVRAHEGEVRDRREDGARARSARSPPTSTSRSGASASSPTA